MLPKCRIGLCLYLKLWYFVCHDSSGINFQLKDIALKYYFSILIAEFFGAFLNFAPPPCKCLTCLTLVLALNVLNLLHSPPLKPKRRQPPPRRCIVVFLWLPETPEHISACSSLKQPEVHEGLSLQGQVHRCSQRAVGWAGLPPVTNSPVV